jgi:DNA-binding MarR family transcriptional regulator
MSVEEWDLDPVIHAATRLRIMATLATLPDNDSLSFSRLEQLLGLTAGNLITHLRKLEEARYVSSTKTRADGAARTSVRLTRTGRAALEQYSDRLHQLLSPVRPPSSSPAAAAE